jgi:hypothetical protein
MSPCKPNFLNMDLGKTLIGGVSSMGTLGRRVTRDGKVQEQRATFIQSQGMANKAHVIIITNHKGERVGMDTDSLNGIPEEPRLDS